MSALLTFDRLSATRPDGTPLFRDLTLALGRERIGVVGRNGSGKSTLLAIAHGERPPDGGTVTRAGESALLRQLPDEGGTVAEALGIAAPLAAMARLEAGEGTARDAGLAQWDLPERAAQALAEAGLGGLSLDRDPASLSGGERTRLALARLLVARPEILLLDEPTNNLDAAGREAVTRLVESWPGAVLLVSHDRALLERMDRIVELNPVGVAVHGGSWSSFAEARDAARARAADELGRARRDRSAQQRLAQDRAEKQARRDRAGRADRARGDSPRILLGARRQRAEATAGEGRALAERQAAAARAAVEAAQRRVEVVTPRRFALPPSGLPANRTLLTLDRVTLAPDGRRLFGPLSFALTGPERVAVAGPNGSGKTSLLRLIAGELAPSGGRIVAERGRLALLDQHVALLDPARSVVENLRALNPGLALNAAYDAAARFAFRNREAERPVATFSGGERLRAGLAAVFARPAVPQLLVLDEPTNHLDLEAVEELERALAGYDGALLVVSHDEAFLAAIGVGRRIALG